MPPYKLLPFVLVLLLFGCRRQEKYTCRVISSKTVTEKEVWGRGDREMIIFTLQHEGVTIKAHCQSFDSTNHCRELRVGESYDFERDDRLRYLSLASYDNPSWAVLGIEEEKLK